MGQLSLESSEWFKGTSNDSYVSDLPPFFAHSVLPARRLASCQVRLELYSQLPNLNVF